MATETKWRNRIVGYGEEQPEQLLANPRNFRVHPKAQQDALLGVMREVGVVDDVIVNRETGFVVDGHLRVALAIGERQKTIPVKYVDLTEQEEALILATFDPIAAMAATDKAQLDALLREVSTEDAAVQAMLAEMAAKEGIVPTEGNEGQSKEQARKTLAERFIVPPFSVLDARQGYWQERKRAWLALGIQSELGRVAGGSNAWHDLALHPRQAESTGKVAAVGDGPTIFDPVLCEIAYRWFCPPGGLVLDPFAGGSVRGIVAACLGRRYVGIDLRPEQVAANDTQAEAIIPDTKPTWIVGDSRNIDTLVTEHADLVFSCPPYFDLELYSDDPDDLSNAGDYAAFLSDYRSIVAQAVGKLKDDRFACFVVGDIRDKRGLYRNFVSDTIAAFQDAGAMLYNEAILVTAVGSLPIRVGKQFSSGRKLGKTHQNVLVFVKGDSRKATEACGPVEVAVPEVGLADV